MTQIGNVFAFQWEIDLMVMLQRVLGPKGIAFFSRFSIFGEEIVLAIILMVTYWSYDKRIGKDIGLKLLMANVWTPMVKNVFIRRRPYFDHGEINIYRVVDASADPMDIHGQGFSFPSGHSASVVATGVPLAKWFRKKWLTVLIIIVMLLVGISRVVVGAHYPTDVLGGWVFGLLSVLAVDALSKAIKNRFLFYGLLILTGIPGMFFCKSTDFYNGFGLLIGFILGILFEEKYVRFENTRSPLWSVLRVIGGLAVFAILHMLLKMPFSKEVLNSTTMVGFSIRMFRYAIIAFVDFALYPMLFRLEKKIGKA